MARDGKTNKMNIDAEEREGIVYNNLEFSHEHLDNF
jgi:hypothetical protein